jgi:hypothetical protein
MDHQQRGHRFVVHPDPEPVACDARLRYLEDGVTDFIPVPDANLAVWQPLDGEILSELARLEIRSPQKSDQYR